MMRILFSPIGTTDPVSSNNFHDGGCLHILRHYQPERVVLFFTKEMGEIERNEKRYTTAVRYVAPDCIIDPPIFTDIVDASRYEEFSQILPQTVQDLLQKYPEHEILLNLSSGTPQIKTILAMLAADNERCIGIQTVTPERRANNPQKITPEELQSMLQMNEDNKPGAVRRCDEPPLKIFRYHAEKNRILALIHSYEYNAALTLARNSRLVPTDAKKLLKHAAARTMLLPDKARKILPEYNGQKLFLFKEDEERLIEYFLIMQIDQENERLSNFMLRITPFLYEFLHDYVAKNVKGGRKNAQHIDNLCIKKYNTDGYILQCKKIKKNAPNFLVLLDQKFAGSNAHQYTNTDLSFLLLIHYCTYMQEAGLAKDAQLHSDMMDELGKLGTVRKVRNSVAHVIVNVTRESFQKDTQMTPPALMDTFAKMLTLVYGTKVKEARTTYSRINSWLEEALEIHE